MRLSYDDHADALYIRLSDAEVAGSRVVDEARVLDVDRAGHPVGIEVLGVSDGVDLTDLVDRFDLYDFKEELARVEMKFSPVAEA